MLLEKGKDTVVLCEDYLSAVRVSEFTDAMAILSTSLPERALRALLEKHYKNAVVWLDNDNVSVRQKERQLVRKLSLFVPNVRYVEATDPKHFSSTLIHSTLEGVLNEST